MCFLLKISINMGIKRKFQKALKIKQTQSPEVMAEEIPVSNTGQIEPWLQFTLYS